MNKNYPDKIMGNVYWSFIGHEPYYTDVSFEKSVAEYYNKLNIDEAWDSKEIVLNVATVQIQYLYMEYDKEENDFVEVEPMITLKAKNGKYFTALELLYNTHNEVLKNINDTPAHFFEGFMLYEESADKEVPLYFLICGS
jgi:hypothetical protein